MAVNSFTGPEICGFYFLLIPGRWVILRCGRWQSLSKTESIICFNFLFSFILYAYIYSFPFRYRVSFFVFSFPLSTVILLFFLFFLPLHISFPFSSFHTLFLSFTLLYSPLITSLSTSIPDSKHHRNYFSINEPFVLIYDQPPVTPSNRDTGHYRNHAKAQMLLTLSLLPV